MSALSNKINSYAIQNGIEFNQAWSNPPTQTGTVQELATQYWAIQGATPVYEPSVGPPGGAGSLRANSFYDPINTSNSFASRVRNTGGSILSQFNDFDISMGYWFKYNSFPTNLSTVLTFGNFLLIPSTSYFVLGTTYDSTNQNHKFQMIDGSGSTTTVFGVADTNWHYFAYRRSGTNAYYYLDGQLVFTRTENILNENASQFQIGSTGGASLNFSNFYLASFNEIDGTDVAEIWTVGSPAPVTVNYSASPMTASAEFVEPSLKIDDIFLATPATASALINHPTIVTTIGDSTYVTTSFIGSAEFLPNFAVVTNSNKNIVITETLNASAQLLDNVLISTGTFVDISVEEFIASATFVKPFIAEQPFIASATMPGGTATVQASYFSLVKSLNPVFYYNFDESTMQNYGSWNISSYNVDTRILKNQASTGDMSLIGAGKSWKFGGSSGGYEDLEIIPQNEQGYYPPFYNPYAPATNTNPIMDLQKSRSYAIEGWFKPDSPWSGLGIKFGIVDFRYHHAIINLVRKEGLGIEIDATLPAWSDGVGAGVPGLSRERLYTIYDNNYIIPNDWNHVVLNFSPSYDVDAITGELVLTTNRQNLQFWVNGNLVLNRNYLIDYNRITAVNVGDRFSLQETYDDDRLFATSYSTPSPYNETTGDAIGGKRGFWRDFGEATGNQAMFDEFAIYHQPLTNSQILDHYYFVANQNPNRVVIPVPLTAEATSGNHIALAQSDRNIAANAMLGSSDFIMPTVSVSTSLNYFASALSASALNTNVLVFVGSTISANSAIASAEAKEGFHLNSIYSDYVQANIAPYRYVTFDAENEYLDYGTDNDYSISPTAIGGTIVNPDLGINGKSVKTAGTSYVTDGVILKESEWNDSWGTGQNSYHSAFWFQRSLDDASTTGLRVLWNLNGYKDNQHVVLYQYQGKLHMQFNNGSGTWIEEDSGTLDLFDYNPHFIVIEFDHTNVNNNTVRIYVDAVLKITSNIGSYTGTTTNATSADSGPNNEANNHPRLSIGCLITPFILTALPVVPTNTKLIIDEVYWDKNLITSTMVANLFNAMPDKTSSVSVASPFLCDATIVNPQISTSTTVFANSLLSNAIFVMPTIFVQFSNTYSANALVCSAEMLEAVFNTDLRIYPDVFFASAVITEPVLLSGYLAAPMNANIFMNNPSQVMGLPLTDLTDYVRYLRIESYTNQILHYQEVR